MIRRSSVGRRSGRANPSLGHLPSLARAKITEEIADAKLPIPTRWRAYQALRLNLGVPDVVRSVLVDVRTWRRAVGAGRRRLSLSSEYVLGVDLGGSAAMSRGGGVPPVG